MFIGYSVSAQEAMNAYKYVIVPSQFEFQRKAHQYGVNELLKYKFQQLGFETYMDTENIPEHIMRDNCLVLKPVAKSNSGTFITRVSVEVKNCSNEVLFVTEEGKSNDKSYKRAFAIALRQALKSFNGYRLEYKPKNNEVVVVEQQPTQEPITAQPVKDNSSKFLFKGMQCSFIKTNPLYYAEIKNVESDQLIGTLSRSSKQGIYHVKLDAKIGLGYYDEAGSFIIEMLEDNGNVTLQKLQLLN